MLRVSHSLVSDALCTSLTCSVFRLYQAPRRAILLDQAEERSRLFKRPRDTDMRWARHDAGRSHGRGSPPHVPRLVLQVHLASAVEDIPVYATRQPQSDTRRVTCATD